MTSPDYSEWQTALEQMLRRWRLILRKIDARDEGSVLALANMLDEFCEVAVRERQAAASNRGDPAVPVLKFPPDADMSGRCAFCRAFASLGSCFGPLHALNKAILGHHWTAARQVAEEHVERLLMLNFTRDDGGIVH